MIEDAPQYQAFDPNFGEPLQDSIDPAIIFQEIAQQNDVELSEHRVANLVELQEDLVRRQARGQRFGYGNEGMLFSPSDNIIHFTPATAEEPNGAQSAQPQEMTKVMLAGLRGMQDLIIFMDAGFIPRPDQFVGRTNPEMAKLASRLGFAAGEFAPDPQTGKYEAPIHGDFDTVRARIFSSETARLERLLERRLADQMVSPTTLSN